MIVTNLNTKIGDAINVANSMLSRQSRFYSHYTHNTYDKVTLDMGNASFTYVLNRLVKYLEENEVEVKLWRPWKWRFSNAIAMTKGKYIYLNRYKLNRPIESIVGSLVHELVHICDLADENKKYGHGTNYRYDDDFPAGKRRTNPYLFGELANHYAGQSQVYPAHMVQLWQRGWDND